MKFVILALFGLVSINAIKLRQREGPTKNGPLTGEDLMNMCDANGDNHVKKSEVWACISAEIPEEDK